MCGRKDLSGTRLDPHQAVLVANLTGEPSARFAAARINRLSLEYLADPQMLRPSHPPDAPLAPAPVEPRAAAVREPSSALIAPMEPTISPGTVLDGPSILTLCRARDLGAAAATGDPANPPEILRGVDPSRWPQLVVKGRQAVTDLVGSVIPMVFAPTRRNTERCGHPRSDVRRTHGRRLPFRPSANQPRRLGQLRLDDDRTRPLARRRRRRRGAQADHWPSTHDGGPRRPGPGQPSARPRRGRRGPDDRLWTPFDKGTDPVLERAQRQFEQAFPPPASPETSRGLQR